MTLLLPIKSICYGRCYKTTIPMLYNIDENKNRPVGNQRPLNWTFLLFTCHLIRALRTCTEKHTSIIKRSRGQRTRKYLITLITWLPKQPCLSDVRYICCNAFLVPLTFQSLDTHLEWLINCHFTNFRSDTRTW